MSAAQRIREKSVGGGSKDEPRSAKKDRVNKSSWGAPTVRVRSTDLRERTAKVRSASPATMAAQQGANARTQFFSVATPDVSVQQQAGLQLAAVQG